MRETLVRTRSKYISLITLDDALCFLGAKHVLSYLGLVPREYSSGERQRRRISKAGSARAGSLMIEAAWSLLRLEDRDYCCGRAAGRR